MMESLFLVEPPSLSLMVLFRLVPWSFGCNAIRLYGIDTLGVEGLIADYDLRMRHATCDSLVENRRVVHPRAGQENGGRWGFCRSVPIPLGPTASQSARRSADSAPSGRLRELLATSRMLLRAVGVPIIAEGNPPGVLLQKPKRLGIITLCHQRSKSAR